MLVFCQDDGGMLCGGEDEKPIWILRFKILDSETHYPIRYANIEISNDRGDAMHWKANSEGIAVLVVTTPNCLPYDGKFEITSKYYRYYQESFERNYFSSYEDSKRIYLEGHRHNWTDLNQIPETQELINKISRKQYQVGIKKISSGHGFDWVNYAPACFEYKIELDKIRDDYYQPSQNSYHDREKDNNQNSHSKIPTVSHNGENFYVFPNDLSGGTYHVEQAKSACGSLNRLGYDDWYLPSKEELNILYLNKEEIRDAEKMLSKFSVDKDNIIIGINAGAAYGPAKCWLPERYHEVAKRLLNNPRVVILFFGDNSGASLINYICNNLPKRAINLAGMTTLRMLMALIYK